MEDLAVSVETMASRTDITFSCLLHIYDGQIEVLESNHFYATTYGYKGDFSDIFNEMESEYLCDYAYIMSKLKSNFPDFEFNFDNHYVSLIGDVLEHTDTEGDWETGYYTILLFEPDFISFEMVPKETYKIEE